MARNAVFYSAKGGQGVTVTAAAYAIQVAESGLSTILVDFSGGDCFPVLGMPEPQALGEPREANANLRVVAYDPTKMHPGDPSWSLGDADAYVFDAPAIYVNSIAGRYGASACLVTRGCYLALRKALAIWEVQPDSVVLIDEPGRSLKMEDVSAVLNVDRVTPIKFDPAIARAVDAGLLLARLPQALRRIPTPAVA